MNSVMQVISASVEMMAPAVAIAKPAAHPRSAGVTDIADQIRACTLCRDRFAQTATAHAPNPVVWFRPGARILIASQAPGLKVHRANTPFWDASGKRLRSWLGMDDDTFYDRDRVAIVPMAFCFPGYDDKGSDLPPPPVCSQTWRRAALDTLPDVALTVVIGAYAMRWHLGRVASVTAAVAQRTGRNRQIFALPHPSWRNTGWLKKNPWFEQDVVPDLQRTVREVLHD